MSSILVQPNYPRAIPAKPEKPRAQKAKSRRLQKRRWPVPNLRRAQRRTVRENDKICCRRRVRDEPPQTCGLLQVNWTYTAPTLSTVIWVMDFLRVTVFCRLLCDCGNKCFKRGILSGVSSSRQSGRAAEFETTGSGAGGRQRRPQINSSPPECGAESISGLLQATARTRGITKVFHTQPLIESHLLLSNRVGKVCYACEYSVRSCVCIYLIIYVSQPHAVFSHIGIFYRKVLYLQQLILFHFSLCLIQKSKSSGLPKTGPPPPWLVSTSVSLSYWSKVSVM